MDLTATLHEIKKWPADEQLKLVEAVWEQLRESGGVGLTQDQRDELDRRIEDHERNADDVVSWDLLRARLRKS
ncbi:MAG: addiction module protein [Fimbriimonas sp.]